MKKKGIRSLLCGVLLSGAFTLTALGFNHYSIDVDALKELTKTDSFELQITKKTVADGVGGGLNEPRDMLTFTVENTSGKKVESLKVMIVCYDEENKATQLVLPNSMIVTLGGRQKREFTLKELAVENGNSGSFQLNIPCSHASFTGLSALIASYTADGEEVMNPLAEEWNELALGSPTHILD